MNAKDVNRKTLQLFWQHAWRYPKYVLGLLLVTPVTLLVHQFLPPLIVASVLERLSTGKYAPHHAWASFGHDLILYAVLVILGGVVLWRVVIILVWKLESVVVRDMYQRMFDHLMGLSAGFHADTFSGSLVSQTNKFTSAYVRVADTTLFQLYTLALALLFTTVILLPRAPLFVALLLVFSAVFILTAIFVTKKVRQLNAIEASKQNIQTGFLADMTTNVLAVKSFAARLYENKRYKEATEDTRQATLNIMRAATKRDAYFAFVTSTISVVSLTVAVIGVVSFKADIAVVFLVLSYTANITQRLWDFSQSTLRNYNRAIGDAFDATQTLLLKPTVKDPVKPEAVRIHDGDIKIQNMTFTHDGSHDDEALFRKLNIDIPNGQKLGLVGHSGSGKTSLTKLLLRFSDIDGGTISIDGQDISKITQDDLRRNIAYVPQEPLLFHRTINENIAYGLSGATEKQIRHAADQAHATEFIETLPQGFETLVGERGVKLSGGQRQRVAIARAMLKNAPILVLDEATSALDSESEVLIQDALWKLMEGRTAIVIAHRLSTIQKMDRILVLENGTIVEEGTHKELIRQNGTYAQLWAHQSGGFLEE